MTSITVESRRNYRLGHDLTGATDIDQALKLAELDWRVNVVPAENMTVNGVPTSMPGKRLGMRSDNGVILGVYGGRYQKVDNHDVFGIGEHILNQGGIPVNGGALDFGRVAFMEFDLPGTNVELLGGKDLIKFGVTIRADHAGRGNVVARLKAKRLVCLNGMTTQIKGLPHEFVMSHTGNPKLRLLEAERVLKGATQYAKGFAAVAQHMIETPMDRAAFIAYIDRLWPAPSDTASKRDVTNWETRRTELLALFQFAETNDLGRDTAWAGFNAITEYADWGTTVKQGTNDSVEEARARRQFDGTMQDIKDRALSVIVPDDISSLTVPDDISSIFQTA